MNGDVMKHDELLQALDTLRNLTIETEIVEFKEAKNDFDFSKLGKYFKDKFFPLPDYEVSNERVMVTITGKILDMDYARLLAQNASLSLDDIIMLDKVQKKKILSATEIGYLKQRKFIEGRKNNYYLSYRVVKPTEDEGLMSEYVANKSFDDEYFKKLILEYITKQGKTRRRAIDNFIIPKLSAVLSEKQKKEKVKNFLSSLRMKGVIISTSWGVWEVRKV